MGFARVIRGGSLRARIGTLKELFSVITVTKSSKSAKLGATKLTYMLTPSPDATSPVTELG